MSGRANAILRRMVGAAVMLGAVAGLQPAAAAPTLFEGTLYYTHYDGGTNVWKIDFSYDATSGALGYGPMVGIAALSDGADGIMFAPNGNLIVTGNFASTVYRLDAASGSVLQTVATGGSPDFHMALDPTGTKFYSSDYYTRDVGPLDTFSISAAGVLGSATTSPIFDATGAPSNITQLAFDPGSGKVFYTKSKPNCCGSVGLFGFGAANTASSLVDGVRAAHGIVYDPFTHLMTMFGGGAVSTLDPSLSAGAIAASLKSKTDITCDFDQGSVDGYGHAFIAGCGAMTFIDYSVSGDITSPDRVIVTDGFGAIDDIAPLVGLGAPPPGRTPEPGSLLLVALAAVALVRIGRKRLQA